MRELARTIVRLNVETKELHAAVDAPWLELIARGDDVSRFDYVEHLVRVYGFDAPVEAALAYTPHLDGFFDMHRYSRAGLVAQDLLTLGVTPGEMSAVGQCMLAPFACVAEACGWLYVHQRSTLHHAAVRSHLLDRLPELSRATTYLGAHDGHIGSMWDAFGQAIDRVARTPHIEDRIVKAALDAFAEARAWFERTAPATQRYRTPSQAFVN